jgi:hypothetical protein
MKLSCNLDLRFFKSYRYLFTVIVFLVPLLPGFSGGRLAWAQASSIAPSPLVFDAPPQNPDTIITGKPYEANRTLHTTRFLADGTVAAHDFTIREARDSSGRHLEEMQIEIPAHEGHPAFQFVTVLLLDPAALTSMTWTSLSKVGTLSHFHPPIAIGLDAPKPKAEDQPVLLGHTVIQGLTCTGYSVKHVTPAGMIGNAKPLISRHEWWVSDELQFKVLEINSDPQHGERTNELVELKRTEPAPSRFHLPSGYTVKELNPPSSAMKSANLAKPLDLDHVPVLTHDEALEKLSSQDQREQLVGAAVLVKEAQASSDPAMKDDIAYRVARANVGLAEVQALAESAVKSAEVESSVPLSSRITVADASHAITLSRRWLTLGYIHYREDDTAIAKTYMESAWKLDPLSYYGARLARLAEETGDTEGAVQIYRAALEAPGGEGEKSLIQERLNALAGSSEGTVVAQDRVQLTGGSSVTGAAFFDVVYSADSALPAVLFVKGTEALQSLSPEVAKAEADAFVLPDKGPERVVRRVEVSCNTEASRSSSCSLRALGAHQLRTLIQQP